MKNTILTILVLMATSIHSAVIAQNSSANTPCKCCTEEYRGFDFWIGDWTVTQNGKNAGENKITISQDSCLIIENWISASPGYTGTSFNYYDASNKLWHQTWVDNQGGSLRLSGTAGENTMTLMDQPTLNAKNQLQINKITWTKKEDGTVHQLWEVSTDLGKSWQVLFNGLYKKK